MADAAAPYLSPKALAARWAVSVMTVHRMIRAGTLPAMRPSERCTRIPLAAVQAMEGGR